MCGWPCSRKKSTPVFTGSATHLCLRVSGAWVVTGLSIPVVHPCESISETSVEHIDRAPKRVELTDRRWWRRVAVSAVPRNVVGDVRQPQMRSILQELDRRVDCEHDGVLGPDHCAELGLIVRIQSSRGYPSAIPSKQRRLPPDGRAKRARRLGPRSPLVWVLRWVDAGWEEPDVGGWTRLCPTSNRASHERNHRNRRHCDSIAPACTEFVV
jgi:hypothetical protein